MHSSNLFYLLFFSQAALVSLYFPFKIIRRVKRVISAHPPSEFPKLYPKSPESILRGLEFYKSLNLFIFLIGFALAFHGVLTPGQELLNWDNQSVVLGYFFLQMTPMLIADRFGLNYYKLMREAYPLRKAELRPRRLLHFIHPGYIAAAVITYVLFVLLVIYVNQNPFPGFAGYWNILLVTILNLVYAGVIGLNLYGKKKDPHQSQRDRNRQLALLIKKHVLFSILGTGFLGILFILPALELRHFTDISIVVYLHICAALAFKTLHPDETNFDVYRERPVQAGL